jgi:PST family polysaccharide transporter
MELNIPSLFDSKGTFLPPVNPGGLRQAAVRSAGVTLLSGAAGLAIQIVSAVVLARILTPNDFGLVTMATTFSLLFMNFGLNGFTEAILQKEGLDRQLASNLFWINLAGSTVLTLVFAAGGSVLAHLYGDPRIIHVAQAMSFTILFTGLSVIHLALLKKAMQFTRVSGNDLAARGISVTVAVILGLRGWGYWALVLAAVTLTVTTCLGAWFFCRWFPSFPRRNEHTGSMVSFALHTYGRFITGYFSNNLDNFLVGWKLGAASLGFYKKAFDLFVLPTNQLSLNLTNVAVSALSRFQRDLEQYKRYFLGALGVMAFIGMGLGACLTLAGKDLVLVLLGPKWEEAGRIFTLFGPGIGAMLLYCAHIWIHLSIGKADRWFRWGLIDLFVTALFLIIGLHWGAEGVAVGWVVAYWIIMLPALWYAGSPIQLGIAPLLGAIWRYVMASLSAGLCEFLIARNMPAFAHGTDPLNAAIRLFSHSFLFFILYLAAVVILHRGYSPIIQVGGLLREMVAKRRSSRTTIVSPEAASS